MRGIETFHEEPHCLPAMAHQVMGMFCDLAVVAIPLLRSFHKWLLEDRSNMPANRAYNKLSVILVLTSVALFTTSAFGQSPATGQNNTDKAIAAVRDPGWEIRRDKVAADEPKRKDLQSEVEAMKAENAAVRELLRKMEEQQKTLLEQVDRLQRRLDGGTATDVSIAGQPVVPPATADASVPARIPRRYPSRRDRFSKYFRTAGPLPHHRQTTSVIRDGIIIWQTSEGRKGAVPAEVQQQYPTPISQYTCRATILSPTTWALSARLINATTSR